MNYWLDWEFSERELMEIANTAIFHDRPDLQFKFDGSAPPLLPAIADTHPKDGDVEQAPLVSGGGAHSAIAQPSGPPHKTR